jgi:hypothetical protein
VEAYAELESLSLVAAKSAAEAGQPDVRDE